MVRRFEQPPRPRCCIEPASEGDLPTRFPFFILPLASVRPIRTKSSLMTGSRTGQRHPGRFNVLLRQLQILLHFVDHHPPSRRRVDAEMIKRQLINPVNMV
ncbi:unnamed protein product [Lactuca virosa]|uniref:Uncharacterized protein n=1 Tax=Lactuca virosa TaxID=75947 RepID=A0AAU9MJF4_9ASTR|nr:unnamed protein product [Lactuca virosa]